VETPKSGFGLMEFMSWKIFVAMAVG